MAAESGLEPGSSARGSVQKGDSMFLSPLHALTVYTRLDLYRVPLALTLQGLDEERGEAPTCSGITFPHFNDERN